MFKRVDPLRVVILLTGLLAIGIGGWWIWMRVRHLRLYEEQIQPIRQMALSDDPGLAEVLDRSVVRIAAGDFLMGSNHGREDEVPQRPIYLDAFEIDRFEVTNIQFQRYLLATGDNPPPYWPGNGYPPGQADYPVVGVSWDTANAYCAWVGKRLPTEAEWEKACRGTDGRVYPWGDIWQNNRGNVALFPPTLLQRFPLGTEDGWQAAWQYLPVTQAGVGEPGLRPVGSYLDDASPYGVMDLAGNASEWVFDWYNWSDYSEMSTSNPIGLGPPWNHCVRGSSWYDPTGNENWVQNASRCSARNSSHSSSDPQVGFRCARTP
ncbi:MAG: SUMF1/EgtB/PvdO family nonheme iron enzyme [Anaerolineales bacterium]|nr:SUMF1/EgtB/PvdO family nonheme iron enzyme [Anaerolineales bacterium]